MIVKQETDTTVGLDEGDVGGGKIQLLAKDGTTFDVDKRSAFISQLIKTSLESDTSATQLELTLNGRVLRGIVEYMQHHNGIEPPIVEKPLRSKVMKDVCRDQWDADWIDRIGTERQYLYDLILGANYLHINSLLHLACAKVASLIKGQPLDKIKDILSAENAANNQQNGTNSIKQEQPERKE